MDYQGFMQYLKETKAFSLETLKLLSQKYSDFQQITPTTFTETTKLYSTEKPLKTSLAQWLETHFLKQLKNENQEGSHFEIPTVKNQHPFEKGSQEFPELILLATEKRYLPLGRLGEGGMGVVTKVQDKILGREVALKTIKTRFFSSEEDLKKRRYNVMLWRLLREASIMAVLEHPNVVPLYDMQQNKTGEIWFTMRKIVGNTLQEIFQQKLKGKANDYDENKLLSIFLKICDAIAYAHSQGIIHRDLKPENIMVGQFGEVYVMDWGIAKRVNEKEEVFSVFLEEQRSASLSKNDSLTNKKEMEEELSVLDTLVDDEHEGDIHLFETIGGLGTPGYMPPEQQLNASSVNEQADIFSLGILLRQCFVYLSPLEELKKQISTRKRENKNNQEQKVPIEIQAIFDKATQTEDCKRYQKVQQLTEDIERYQKNIRVSVKEYTLAEIAQKWTQRNKSKIVFVMFVFLLVLDITLYFQWKEGSKRKQEFKDAFAKAQKEKKIAGNIQENSKKERAQKMEYLLSSFHYLNVALQNKPKDPNCEREKLGIGQELLELCALNKDYQMARYVAKELQQLSLLSKNEKHKIKEKVQQRENENLRKNQKRLAFWLERLQQNQLKPWEKENALFEISKMKEPEIFQKLLSLLEEGTNYFLTSKNRNLRKDTFYNSMVDALGRLENPETAESCFKALERLGEKLAPLSQKPIAEIDFMVSLSKALVNSKAKNTVNRFREIRFLVGEHSPFWNRTSLISQELALQEDLEIATPITAKGFMQQGFLKEQRKDYAGALADFAQALQLDPKRFSAHNAIGLLQQEQGDLTSALKSMSEAVRLNPKFLGGYINRASIKEKLGNIKGALEDYDLVISLDPEMPHVYLNRGVLKGKEGKFVEAILDFEKVIELDPQNAAAYNNLGKIKLDKENYQGALFEFSQAILLEPKDPDFYLNRAFAKKELGLFSEALKDINKIIYLAPENSEAYLYRGRIKDSLQDYEGALLDYKHALELGEKEAQVYFNRAVTLENSGKISAAIKAYDKVIELNPEDKESYNNRGLLKQDKGLLKEALADMNSAIRIDPSYIEAYNNRGTVKQDLKDYQGAINDFDQVLQVNPKFSSAILNKGFTYLLLEQKKEAIEYLSQGLDLYGNHPLAEVLVELLLARAKDFFHQQKFQAAYEDLVLFQKYASKEHDSWNQVEKMKVRLEKFKNATKKE